MATLKVQRGPIRAAFTRVYGELKAELAKEEMDKDHIRLIFKRLQDRRAKLQELDQAIESQLLEAETSEEDFGAEYESVMDYSDKFSEMELKMATALEQKKDEDFETASSSGSHSNPQRTKYRLPKLEFKKFGGEPKEWLGFWSQFRSIAEDEDMAPTDKFQYLVQATTEQSAARMVVESFPPTAANFPKVIDYMKNRFGNEDVLVEVYVRELLRLVLERKENKTENSVAGLYDQLETQLRALESLGVTSDKYVAMLFPLVESALPEETMRAWERIRTINPSPNEERLKRMMGFLRAEVDSEIRIKLAKTGFGSDVKSEQPRTRGNRRNEDSLPTAVDLFSGQSARSCVFCDKNHESNDCYTAGKLSLEEKIQRVKEKKACFYCLRKGHFSKTCKGKPKCHICDEPHYVTMCPDLPKHKKPPETTATTTSGLANFTSSGIILQTLLINLKGDGRFQSARAIIDTGSQHSYLTEKAVSVLGLKSCGEVNMAHCLFGGQETKQKVHKLYRVTMQSTTGQFQCISTFMDQPKICGTVSSVPKGPWLEELEKAGIQVTDVDQNHRDIHVLIGADIAGTFFTGKMYPTIAGPVAMETRLGWTVMGRCRGVKSSADSTLLATSLHVCNVDLQNLWRMDLIGITDSVETKSKEDLMDSARIHFEKTVQRDEDGRYEVSLPWIEGHPPVSTNRDLAEKRLKSAYRKLQESGYVQSYQQIFNEWEQLGIIEKVKDNATSAAVSYLPHRPVFKVNSATTPIRPVFDASAKCGGLPSLNDCLEKGPNLIELVPDVLTRFRLKRFGVVSDIKKAFLQVSVRREDRDFLRFLWWENGKLQLYRHCRVVFGVSSSPFLLAATINYHLDRTPCGNEAVVEVLKKSFYVDNSIASVDSERELSEFVREATTMMSKGKMDLRGWAWSRSEKLPIEPEDKDDQELVSVLGLLWNRNDDTLSPDMRECSTMEGNVTKRKILSAAHRIFDPLGISCPVTLVPKLMLQELWSLKLGWDEPVPVQVEKGFRNWEKRTPALAQVRFPRWIMGKSEGKNTLHVFMDASSTAYAACVFLRNKSEDVVNVQLMMAKSRVASTKKMTIPRLELLGCCIGARLALMVKKVMEEPDIETYYWTDSSNALYWIQKNENWATFVWNRVQEIRKLSKASEWRHVAGSLNPADLPSRGCHGNQLLASKWWEGPEWLKLSPEKWPISEVQCDIDQVMLEKRKTVISQLSTKHDSPWYLRRFSSYRKVVRLIGWIMRWRNRARGQQYKGKELLQEEETLAESQLMKMVQQESLQQGDPIFKQLGAVKDESGVWRVQTKIIMREDFRDFKYPTLVPHCHPIVKLLLRDEHLKRSHCGNQVLMAVIRERFWIPKSRNVIRSVISSCGSCRRFRVKNVTTVEAPLPVERVRDAAVFEVTGVDLGGPLHLKNKEKAWFVLYTCAVYRAVHLEVVSSLSTEGFLQTLRRFIARRGRPSVIYSDNGTNFEGASNLLKKIDWRKIESETAFHQLKWRFNPPSAPWWGGWWERIVGMVKVLLRRILGRACLSYEELVTVMCDVESIINSRPLTYITENPDDLVALSPNLFLIDDKPTGTPDLDEVDMRSLNKRIQYRQQLKCAIRKRFRDEYLGYLLHRNPKKNMQSIRVGDVVLVGCDNKKRLAWPLARVVELISGRDGVQRVAKLKTATGEMTRPIQRLFPLEMSVGMESEVETLSSKLKTNEMEKQPYVTRSGRVSKLPVRFME
jgi:hypothetical protein